ncbi:MAG: GNAT family N-acetyltransferase [Alphaproteobacteria bacterium]|jgi:GNAT superfamily N-acetyltransferase|nr:GNAT family N-acetyltransferase [Alphaproteobacteria bacterium]
MLPDGLTFERASRDDVDTMVDWAAREGWNPGTLDGESFHAADPNGFWLARMDDQMVACMSLVTYSADFAFLGFYIADPAFRGQGIGYGLWQTALNTCSSNTIGLDGVVDQQDNYQKSGFILAHRNIRFGGIPEGMAPGSNDLVTMTPAHTDMIAAYDQNLFPAPRRTFLAPWLTSAGHLGVVSLTEGAVNGYGVIRPSHDGHKIGPLFAEMATTAASIFDTLVRQSGCQTVFIDPPKPNAQAIDFYCKRGLSPVFETARMYRGPAPVLPLDQIFGITSFELG